MDTLERVQSSLAGVSRSDAGELEIYDFVEVYEEVQRDPQPLIARLETIDKRTARETWCDLILAPARALALIGRNALLDDERSRLVRAMETFPNGAFR